MKKKEILKIERVLKKRFEKDTNFPFQLCSPTIEEEKSIKIAVEIPTYSTWTLEFQKEVDTLAAIFVSEFIC